MLKFDGARQRAIKPGMDSQSGPNSTVDKGQCQKASSDRLAAQRELLT